MQFFEILKAVILGIVEGVTEWLPVSSTGHLILFGEFLGFNVGADVHENFVEEFSEMFNVVIQLGAIFAVIVTFFSRLNPLRRGITKDEQKGVLKLWGKVCVASIPAAVVGLVVDKIIEIFTSKDIDGWLYNSLVVSLALIIYGVLFMLIEKYNAGKSPCFESVDEISYKSALIIGVFQMLAIIPGTSRSGSTILGASVLGVSRSAAAEFSFFLAIPVMLGASLLKGAKAILIDHISMTSTEVIVLIVGTLTAFAVSLVAVKFLMSFVKNHSFEVFGWYRIAIGAILIVYALIKY